MRSDRSDAAAPLCVLLSLCLYSSHRSAQSLHLVVCHPIVGPVLAAVGPSSLAGSAVPEALSRTFGIRVLPPCTRASTQYTPLGSSDWSNAGGNVGVSGGVIVAEHSG